MKTEVLSAEEVTALAEETVTDEMLDKAFKDPHFRGFCRIFAFMLMNTAESKVSGSFGHFLITRDQSNKQVSIDIDIKMNVYGH
jgi:hypothetical protein